MYRKASVAISRHGRLPPSQWSFCRLFGHVRGAWSRQSHGHYVVPAALRVRHTMLDGARAHASRQNVVRKPTMTLRPPSGAISRTTELA